MKLRNLLVVAMLVWAGCGTQDAMPPPLLTLKELDGAWTFVPDPGILPLNPQCFTFQSGIVTSHSLWCDGTNNLVVDAPASLEGNEFSLAFSYAFDDEFGGISQVSASLNGVVTGLDTIQVTDTINSAGDPVGLTIRGRLVRG